MRRVLALPAAFVLAVGWAAPAGAAKLDLAINEPELGFLDAADSSAAAARLRSIAVRYVRISVVWGEVVPTQPPPEHARNPDWSGAFYDRVDLAVRTSVLAGAEPVLVLSSPASWVEAPGKREGEGPGPWRPSADALADFANAMAQRYSGTFTPAGQGSPLPRVRFWQAWNEPNSTNELLPQFERDGDRLRVESAEIYRGLLNAVARGVKAVSPANKVVLAAVVPFGDYPLGSGLSRPPPVQWIERVLCADGRACAEPAHVDVAAFNSFPRTPEAHSPNSGDLYLADAGKVRRILDRAVKAKTIIPARRPPMWVTEVSWATEGGQYAPFVKPAVQASYLVRSLYTMWKEGVSAAFWFRLRDAEAANNNFMARSGLYRRGSTVAADLPKPALASYAFPFLVSGSRAWGIAPRIGSVSIQRRVGGGWRTVKTLRTSEGHVFSGQVRAPAGTVWRAKQLGLRSSQWRAT